MALLERPPVVGVDAEALFREARRRRRRRWTVGVGLALLVAGIAVAVGLASQSPAGPAHPAPKVPVARPGPRPVVDARALGGRGQLAFVSRDALWVLDGRTRALHQAALPEGLVPTSPTFSPDGRWLAFVTGITDPARGTLWIARSDGADAQRVAGLVLGDAFGWSPHADVYAVASGPLSTRAPFGQPTTVRLVSPGGAVRTLATAPSIVGAAWSPTGTSLAVSTMNHRFVSSLVSYTVATGRRTAWAGVSDTPGDFVVPAGWWSGWGVVYAAVDNGSVPDGEGGFEDAALYSLVAPRATPRLLGETVTNDSDGPPSATSTGLLTFVSDAGLDPRTPWNGKQVEVCSAASHACSAVPAPAGDVSEDPVWSPSGSTLAYVAAPEEDTDEFFDATVASWYGSHVLELYNPMTRSASPVASAPGATVPTWSGQGQSVLYIAHDGLWLLPTPTARPVEVSSPLFASPTPASFYGEIDWAQQFGWSAGAPVTQCYVVCNTVSAMTAPTS